MKKIYKNLVIVFLLILSITIQSQTKTYTEAMDSLLTYVSKNQMTTNILYDRVFSFTDIDKALKDTVKTEYFVQAWSELYRASNNPNFTSVSTLKDIAKQSEKQNIVELGVINLKFNYLNIGTDSDAYLTFENGYFYNVPGKNPFLEKTISIVAPLSENVTSSTVNFALRTDLIAQDASLPAITNISADFGDGVQRIITPTSPLMRTGLISVNYQNSGIKNLFFTINFANGTSLSTKSKINISLPSTPNTVTGNYPEYEEFTGNNGINITELFKGYGESVATMGKLEYRTYYNTISNLGYDPQSSTFSIQPKLRKPIYVLDGYDPGNKISIDMIYNMLGYDIDNLPNNGNEKNLIDELRNLGYDVTLVNFPNGADFIERNAMAVVALLQRENQKLIQNGSTGKSIILGPSMGGLVGRYALAYMEKKGINHNTWLYASYDTPHLGANIPISAQSNLYFYGFVGGNETARTKYVENFFSPAAREMLIEVLDEANPMKGSGGQNSNDPMRKIFLQNMKDNGVAGSNGFPLQTRNLAISNGNTASIKNVNEGQCLLEMAAFKKILGANAKVATLVDYALPTSGNTSLNFEGRYSRTYKCRIGFATVTCDVSIYNTKVNRTNLNVNGSMDAIQGSTYNTMMIIKDEFQKVLNENTSYHEWRQGPFFHTFMPTVSTLAFRNPNFNWNDNISRNLLCNDEIPFQSYYISYGNDPHVNLNKDIADWLTQEITGHPQSPHLMLSNVVLSSTKVNMCINDIAYVQTNTVDLCSLPSGFYWTVSPNLQIVGSNSGATVQVKAIGNGLGFVYMNFDNGQKITKKIWVGLPSITVKPDPGNSNLATFYLQSTDANATLDDQGLSPSNVKWRRLDNNQIKTGYSYFTAFPNYNGGFSVEIKATNSCGTTTKYVTIAPPPPPSCNGFKVAKSGKGNNAYIIIDPCAKNSSSQGSKLTDISMQIMDINGKKVVETTNLEFNLDDKLPGTYYLRIMKNSKVVHSETLLKN